MITLKDILYKVTLDTVVGSTNVMVRNIHFNSRSVAINDVFVAIKGTVVDGHQYIESAINQGAIAVVCEVIPAITKKGVILT